MAPSTGWSALLLLIVISLSNQNHQQFDLDSDSEIDLEVSENNNHDFLGTHYNRSKQVFNSGLKCALTLLLLCSYSALTLFLLCSYSVLRVPVPERSLGGSCNNG